MTKKEEEEEASIGRETSRVEDKTRERESGQSSPENLKDGDRMETQKKVYM